MLTQIDHRYQVIRKLGEGGMGDVYLVEDRLRDGRQIALKTIKPDQVNPNVIRSFRNEFEVMTRLKHPNLAQVYDFGRDRRADLYYLTLEYIPGMTLSDALRQHPDFSRDQILEMVVTLCRALEFIHSRQIFHRDVKPGNIMLTEDRQVKLMDFGLADLEHDGRYRTKGTLLYMAPEVVAGQFDRRSDIFALGMTAYELLTQKLLLKDGGSNTILNVLRDDRRYAETQKLAFEKLDTPELRTLLQNMTAYQASDRYERCSDVILDINRLLDYDFPLETDATRQAYVLGAGFVGRETEFDQLTSHLEQPSSALQLISGETGIGKSRLMQEFRKYCQINDVEFVESNLSPRNNPPFALFLSILAERLLAASDAAIDTYGPELKKLLPHHPRFTEITANTDQDPKTEQRLLIQNITRFLLDDQREERPPWVLYINNLHWLDESSLATLLTLLDKWQASPEPALRIVASFREEEPTPLHEQIETWRERHAEINLKPFDRSAIRAYLEAIFGADSLGESLRSKIPDIEATIGGNPFFLQEWVRSLMSTDQIRKSNGKWVLTDGAQRFAVPDSLKTIVEQRLHQLNLTPPEETALDYLALLNRSVTIHEFRQLLPAEIDVNAATFFEHLERTEILETEFNETGTRYRFTHPLMAQILQEKITKPAEYHLHIARQLEQLYDETASDHLHELAHHYQQSSDEEKAIYYLEQVARQAHNRFANQQALECYDQLLGRISPNARQHRAEIMLRKGQLLDLTGQWEAAKATYQEAISQAPKKSVLLGRLKRLLGTIFRRRSSYEFALSLFDEAHEIFSAADAKTDLASIEGDIGHVYYDRGEYEPALEHYQRRLELGREIDDPKQVGIAKASMGNIHFDQGNYDEAMACFQERLTVAEQMNDKRAISLMVGNIGVIYQIKNETERARECYQRKLEVAEEIGDRHGISLTVGNIGTLYQLENNLEAAEQCFQRQRTIGEELGDKLGVSRAIGNLGNVYQKLGELDRALEHLERRVELSEELGDQRGLSIGFFNLAKLYRRLGKTDRVESYFDRAIAIGRDIQLGHYLGEYLCEKAEFCFQEKRFQDAATLLEDLEAEIEVLSSGDLKWRVQVLTLKLQYVQADSEDARQQALNSLQHLLLDSETPEHQAKLNLELFRLTDEPSYGQAARNLYQQLMDETGNQDYQDIVDELGQVPPSERGPRQLKHQLERILDKVSQVRQQVQHAEPTAETPAVSHDPRLLEVLQLISQNLRLEDLLNTVIDVSLELTGAERGFLMLIQPDGSFDFKVARSMNRQALEGDSFDVSRTVVQQVVQEQEPLFIADTGDLLEINQASSIVQLELLSVICVPLVAPISGELIGLIYVDSQSVNQAFDAQEMELLKAVAGQAAISIENAQLYGNLKQNQRDLALLYEVGKAMNSTLDLDELLTLIVDTTIEITSAQRGFLMLATHQGRRSKLTFRIARNQHNETLEEDDFEISDTIANSVLERREPILLADVERDRELVPASSSIMNLQLKSVIAVPLMLKQKLLGLIYVDTSIVHGNFSERELDLLTTLSSQAAIALENATLYSDLQRAHHELTELDDMKSKFISLASHELRTPMTVIAGYLYILGNLAKDLLPEKARDVIEIMRKSMEKLTGIVNNIANMARLTAPEYSIEMQQISLRDVIGEVERELRPFIDQREQTLIITVPESEITIEADEQSIWQAITNLVINAIRFTEDGGTIEIYVTDEGATVEVGVRDSGIGIPADEHQNIFKQFYEIGDVLYHSSGHFEFKSGGLGVGLSIAKMTVEQHGGTIGLESEVGKGSTFFMQLPKRQ